MGESLEELEEIRITKQDIEWQNMSMEDFIADIERSFFRTAHDTGANTNAMLVWNCLRRKMGMPALTRDDLIRRHADTLRVSFEEMKEDYRRYEEYKKSK